MNGYIKYLVTVIILTILSCEDKGLFIRCPECESEEPVDAILEAKVEPYELFNFVVVIKLYEGNIEDSILLATDLSGGVTWSDIVKINKKYTVSATYNRNGIYYTTIDSATPRVKYEKDLCDKPCYFVYDRKLDLRIKYY